MNRFLLRSGSVLAAVYLVVLPVQAVQLAGEALEFSGVVSVSVDYQDSDVSEAEAKADSDDKLIPAGPTWGGNPTRVSLGGKLALSPQTDFIYELSKSISWDGSRTQIIRTRAYSAGVSTPMGKIIAGEIATPFRDMGSDFAVLRTTVAHRHALMGATTDRGSRANRRAEKAINWSNTVELGQGSLHWNLLYSGDAIASEGDPDLNNRSVLGFSLQRQGNGYMVGIAHDRWEKLYGGPVEATRLVLKKTIGRAEVGLLFETINQDLVDGTNSTLDRDAYGANIAIPHGGWLYMAQAIMADDYEGSSQTGALMLSVGASRQINDSLIISLGYSQTDNEDAGAFQAIDGSRGDLGTLPGGTPRAFGFAARYYF